MRVLIARSPRRPRSISTLAFVVCALVAGCSESSAGPAGTDMNTHRISYGDAERQFGVLSLPEQAADSLEETETRSLPVAVLVHGGFWRNRWTLTLMDPMAEDLVEAGFAVWNIEYRSVGDDGGGYPGTLDDVGAAFDTLADLATDYRLDLDRVSAIGHSAGGHLVLWSGSRHLLPAGAPGASPQVRPTAIIALAPVVDLEAGVEEGLGTTAVSDFIGASPRTRPEWYKLAQPTLDPAVTTIIVGRNDDTVPVAHIETSLDRLGASVPLVIVEADDENPDRDDHMAIIEPGSILYEELLAALE